MPVIAHLADIHWRGMSRHAEYKEIFERMFNQLRDVSPDLIYVGGDIVHSKTQGISPEMIELLVWWFKSLGDIAPTHVILGNHDGLLLNKSRQDTITPIIEALDHPQVFLYKNSGTYSTGIDGFNWCVFSCFDEAGWSDVMPVPGEVNIALFHGPVWNARTDIDWKIEGEVSVDFFSEYDFALLGDIHKVQFLTDDRRVAYSGSTIQQDYGESREKGFLLWNIRSRDDFDVNFHPVHNHCPFVTVDWKGTVDATIQGMHDVPIGARIRVKNKDPVPFSDWKQLCNELEIFKQPTEIVSKDEHEVDTQQITVESVSLFKDDLRDVDTHIKLLREYYSELELDEEDWKELESLTKNYMKSASHGDVDTRSNKWSIKKLEFDNMFSYGKGNVINFSNLNGITGIFGRNATGKSSIVGTIMFTLFNTTDRGPIKNLHVINTRKDYCFSKATIENAGDLVRIERQSVKHKDRKGDVHAITHLNVLRVDENDNVIDDLTEEQRRVSEKSVRSRIGTADDFLLTSLASQGEMNAFIKQKSTARKQVLTRFLGLDIFERMSELSRDDFKIIQGQVKNAPDRDWIALIREGNVKKLNLEHEIQKLDNLYAEKRLDERNLQVRLNSFENSDMITPADLLRQKKIINQAVESYENFKIVLETHKEQLEKIQQEIITLKEENDAVPIEDLKSQRKEMIELEKIAIEAKHGHEKALTVLRHQEKSIAKLLEVPCGDMFPACKFIKDSHEDKHRIEEQRKQADLLHTQLNTVTEALKDLKKKSIDVKIHEFVKRAEKLNTLAVKVAQKESQISTVQSDMSTLKHKIEAARKDLEKMEACVVDEKVDAQLSKIKQQLHDTQEALTKLDAKRIASASQIGKLESSLENLEREKEEYQEIKRKWRIYDLFTQAVSKRGIPLQIIMSQLPVINVEIAKILQGVVSFTIELEADPSSNDMDIYINYGDSRRIIEVASGMEKMIASLAIRVALINVSSLPKPDMLIIDEGFGALDDVNVEACNRLLIALKKWFKTILIISHVDAVKDVVDNVIDITWVGKDAHVFYEKKS